MPKLKELSNRHSGCNFRRQEKKDSTLKTAASCGLQNILKSLQSLQEGLSTSPKQLRWVIPEVHMDHDLQTNEFRFSAGFNQHTFVDFSGIMAICTSRGFGKSTQEKCERSMVPHILH